MNKTKLFSNIETNSSYLDDANRATYKGIVFKTSILLLLTVIISVVVAFSLEEILGNNPEGFVSLLTGSILVGFIAAILGRLSYGAARVCSVIYALCEGVMLGTITRLVEEIVPGAGVICVFATLIIFGTVLALYATGIVRTGSMLMRILIGISIGALLLTLFTLIYTLINPSIYTSGEYFWLIVLIEAFFLVYGVLTLVLDFNEASYIVEGGCSKKAEWSVALGLEITLVYIYIQLLRIVLIIASNKK